MPPEQNDTQIQLLAQKVENVIDTMGRVENKVNELLAIDRTMAQMQQTSSHQDAEIKQLWTRLDTQRKAIEDLAMETRAFINRAGGAWVAAAVLFSMIQIGVCAWVGWVFSSVQFTRELSAVHEHRLKMLEQRDQPKGSNER